MEQTGAAEKILSAPVCYGGNVYSSEIVQAFVGKGRRADNEGDTSAPGTGEPVV